MSPSKTNGVDTRLTYTDRQQYTIDEYANEIEYIWKSDNERPIHILWLYVLKHATSVCEEIRKNSWDKAAEHLAEVIVWWLSFAKRVTTKPEDTVNDASEIVTRISGDISNIIWFKYPGICSTCFSRWLWTEKGPWTKTDSGFVNAKGKYIKDIISEQCEYIEDDFRECRCLAMKNVEVRNEDLNYKNFAKNATFEYANIKIEGKPISFLNISKMLQKIFENNINVLSIDNIAFHLLEEVGEVSTALVSLYSQELSHDDDSYLRLFSLERYDKVLEFSEELSDVFSWSMSLLSKISNYLKCADNFAKSFARRRVDMDGLDGYSRELIENTSKGIEPIISKTNNIIELVWDIYGKSGKLVCEKCKKAPCDQNHPIHKGNRGFLKGEYHGKQREAIIRASEILNPIT